MSREKMLRRLEALERTQGIDIEPIAIMITPMGNDKQRIEVKRFHTDDHEWPRLPDETLDAFIERVDGEAKELSRERGRVVIVAPEL